MDWTKITDVFKLSTKQHLMVVMTTGAVLFAPASLASRLGLDAIPPLYRAAIGLVLILSSVFVTINVASWCVGWYRRRMRLGAQARRAIEKAMDLDRAECSVMREFFVTGQSTIRLPMSNPVVAGLVAAGVIRQVGSYGRVSLHGPLFPYRISDDVNHLIDFDVLRFPEFAIINDANGRAVVTDSGERWLEDNRPSFAYDVAHVDRGIRRW